VKKIHGIIIVISIFIGSAGMTQDGPKKLQFSGFLQSLNSVYVEDVKAQWLTMGTVQNRLNLKWFPHQNWTLSASARNLFSYGQMIYSYYPFYSDLLVNDEGLVNMTWPIAKDSSYLLYTNIDRANIQFVKNNLDVKIGRQRINWGINMVWNPNDIFNTFNFYDFDYIERPGCDAVRLQYYTGIVSSVEFAFKIDKDEEITSAAMYRFNKWNYDFQLMGGVYRDDIVAGLGWSGYIKNAGFTGEGSYFIDRKNISDTTGIFVFSAGANYTFRNSIFLHGSLLYNSNGTTGPAGWGSALFVVQDVTPKTFSLAKYSILGQISYPFTPLINGDITSIYNPNDKSVFIGPNLDFSISDNITLLLLSQIFLGNPGTEFGYNSALFFLRLKWSF
jgi:hypothetical protein